MRLNILNNYKTVYYNFLASFYLCLNCILPYYDDVIISLQCNAIKLLIDNDKLNIKKIKKIRMIELIDTLNRSDKIILDNEKDIIIVDYCICDCNESSNSISEDDSSNPDKDPYEISKNKNIQNDDYIEKPEGPINDCDVNTANTPYYNDVKDEESREASNTPDTIDTTEAPHAPDTQKEYIFNNNNSEIDSNNSEDSSDSCNDNDIDESIRYIFRKMENDKIKDD